MQLTGFGLVQMTHTKITKNFHIVELLISVHYAFIVVSESSTGKPEVSACLSDEKREKRRFKNRRENC